MRKNTVFTGHYKNGNNLLTGGNGWKIVPLLMRKKHEFRFVATIGNIRNNLYF